MLEFTKSGQVSRMRSHAGNVPSLPQTKFCPMCPAKFTRTTHLNRHLRTHSNDRLHVCEKCQAQFTRSDLLARHKRSCGDVNAQRSRRKSCEPCAYSKVKCDQELPCSKCLSRGRECVYSSTRSPSASRPPRRTRSAPSPAPSTSSPTDGAASDVTESASTQSSPPPESWESYFSDLPPTAWCDSPPYSDFSGTTTPSLVTPDGPATPNYQQFITHATPSYFLPQTDIPESGVGRSEFSRHSPVVQSPASSPYCSEVYEKFYGPVVDDGAALSLYNGLSDPHPHSRSHSQGSTSPLPGPQFATRCDRAEDYFSHVPHGYCVAGYPEVLGGASALSSTEGTSLVHRCSPPSPALSNPLPSELDYYLQLFFAQFLSHLPIVHAATFNIFDKPSVLVQAMQACGALYAGTSEAYQFITQTLVSAHEELMDMLSRKAIDTDDLLNLLTAVCLLQTVGLFHDKPELSSRFSVYHATIVMMIRQSGLLHQPASWPAPHLRNPSLIEQNWQDWIRYETAKRLLTLAFLYDQELSSVLAGGLRQDLDFHLPCDDLLWNCHSAHDWYLELMEAGPFGGTINDRLLGGPRMQHCLSRFTYAEPDARAQLTSSLLSQLVQMRCVFSRLFKDMSNTHPSAHHGHHARSFRTAHRMMHNWLRAWLLSPDPLRTLAKDLDRATSSVPPSVNSSESPAHSGHGIPASTPAAMTATATHQPLHLHHHQHQHPAVLVDRGMVLNLGVAGHPVPVHI